MTTTPTPDTSSWSGRPWPEALADAGHHARSVLPIRALDDVRRGLSLGEVLPIGAGTAGARRPGRDAIWVDLRAHDGHPEVDPRSMIVRAPAGATWAEVEDAARAHGLTVRHLVDATPERTVGGTLATRSVLPPLWRTRTVRASCIALEALCLDGAIYRSVEAPRTSTGPDIRATWLETEGRGGVILSASIALVGASSLTSHEVALEGLDPVALRRICERFPGTVNVGPAPEGRARAKVVGDGKVAEMARHALTHLGFSEVSFPPSVRGASWVLRAPWSIAWPLLSRGAAIDAAGPTNVCIRTVAAPDERVPETFRTATEGADGLVAWWARGFLPGLDATAREAAAPTRARRTRRSTPEAS